MTLTKEMIEDVRRSSYKTGWPPSYNQAVDELCNLALANLEGEEVWGLGNEHLGCWEVFFDGQDNKMKTTLAMVQLEIPDAAISKYRLVRM